MNDRIKNLMEQRAKSLANARAILDAAEKEGRGMNADEQEKYNRFDTEVDEFSARIKNEERLAQREAEYAASANGDHNPAARQQPGGGMEQRGERNTGTEYRQGLVRYLVGGGIADPLIRDTGAGEMRTILGVNITSAAAGGVLAPTELERTILDFSKEYNVIRGMASVRSSNSNVEIPMTTGKVQAYHLDEGEELTRSTPSWDKIGMGAYKIGALSVVTNEAMQDMFIDLESWVRDDFGAAFARLEEEDFTIGDGVKKPRGFMLDATVGVTTTSATTIATDELIDLQHALPRQNRGNAVWLTTDATVKSLRKLKDANGQYIWQPGIQAGRPDTLLGRTLTISEFLEDPAAGKKPIAYGDFSTYRILDRRGLYFQRLNELYATSGQVGFLAYKRYDGRLLNTNAIKVLQMKTA
jgi:HK97 family phage major capsid protein